MILDEICYLIILLCRVNSIAPTYLVFDEYAGLLVCTLGCTFVSGRLLTSHVSPLQVTLINDTIFMTHLQDS